jgi:hypothetical protein
MEKQELVNILNATLKPIGFKKKGNYWICIGEKIDKSVNLQRSQSSKLYYINYGFIIKSLPLNNLKTHTYSRVWTHGNNLETDLLNLENSLTEAYRKVNLKEIISIDLVTKMQSINSENDVLEYIKTLPTFTVIPVVVKEYFNIS